MTDERVDDILGALDRLLDAERAALLGGDLDVLTHLLDEKTRLVDRLAGMEQDDRPELAQVRDKVMRNQLLLDGTLEGIRSAARRLSTLRRLKRSFDTYDARGCKRTIEGQVVRNIEKRA